MKIVETFEEVRTEGAGPVGLVPTMGFLHEGHLSLIETARHECETVVMSLYVNALQFGEPSDLDRYPRDFDRDIRLAEDAGVDVVFAPSDATMYVEGDVTRVVLTELSDSMEGRFRPGHFEGVATVITKLLAGLQPDRAYFGRKDTQQLAIVRRLVRDLAFPVLIVGRPVVREEDGLALSSRNVLLDPVHRRAALALSRGLFVAADLVEAGEVRAFALEAAATNEMAGTFGVEPEYAVVASRDDVAPISVVDRPAFLAVAARVGVVRLIDNVHIDSDESGIAVDRGTRLTATSVLYEERQHAGAGESADARSPG